MNTRNTVLIRFGELYLKGKNRGMFEKILYDNICDKLKDIACSVRKTSGRYIVYGYDIDDEDEIVSKIGEVFGIYSYSRAIEMDTVDADIREYVSQINVDGAFRITVHRADKKFAFNSQQYAKELGGVVLDNNKNAVVDLFNPQLNINVDIREDGVTYIFTESMKGAKGLPVGSSSRGLLLLSGGIDSPVAGYVMASRGMPLVGLHFHSYPYTSVKAKEKVVALRNIVQKYTGKMKLIVVNAKEIQEEIHKNCNDEYMITLLRRFMMRIAEIVAKKYHCGAIVTGESLGQVASQTVESINSSNSVVNMPILRPLIAFDKEDITEIANKIGTFETSILPYEDCCTVFLPKHPLIKPVIERVELEEKKLDVQKLIDNAIHSIEVIE